MTGRHHETTWREVCDHCDKQIFDSRKHARRFVRKNLPDKRNTTFYTCPALPGKWHWGHMALNIKKGLITRWEIYPK